MGKAWQSHIYDLWNDFLMTHTDLCKLMNKRLYICNDLMVLKKLACKHKSKHELAKNIYHIWWHLVWSHYNILNETHNGYIEIFESEEA